MSISMSFSMTLCPFLSPSPCLSISMSFSMVYLSISVYICLYLSTSVYICLYLSISESICLYLSISVYICLYLSLSVYICLYLSLSVYIRLYLSISVYICLYLSISVYICHYPSISVYICLYLSISIFISISISTYLSIYQSINQFIYDINITQLSFTEFLRFSESAIPSIPQVTISTDLEPAFVALGPSHLATGMNNRIWFYSCADQVSAQCVNEQEYIGSVESVSLNGTHACVPEIFGI